MINKKILSALLIIFLAFISKSYANDDKKEKGTYLNLSVTETKEIEPDLLVANLRYEIESDSPKTVQNKINRTMKKAIDLAKKRNGLTVSTKGYFVHKYSKHIKKSSVRVDKWKGFQTIVIEGNVIETILSLSGKLQELGFLMNDLHYKVSQKKREQVRESIMEVAINKLLTQAKMTADIIGAENIEVKNINMDGNHNYYNQPHYEGAKYVRKGAMISDSISSPVFSPGTTDIYLTISATILLKKD